MEAIVLSAEQIHKAFHVALGCPPENDGIVAFHQAHHKRLIDVYAAIMLTPDFDEQDYIRRMSLDRRTTITVEELDAVAGAFLANKRQCYADKSLTLPSWFDQSLPADSSDFREQMLRFWSAITNRDVYSAHENEDTPEVAHFDFIRRPAFFSNQDAITAGGHLMAIGHMVTRSELPKNGRVLEYGAGMGQTALTFARLGATVDTVDINNAFCRGVRKLGRHFKVDLKAFHGEFGLNPSGEDHAYDLILFYESFHHCLDADLLIDKMAHMINATGSIIMGGEPIFRSVSPCMPYDWGFRLDWENVAIMRIRGWMELGYREQYLMDMFRRHGFNGEFFPDPNSHWAQVYRFRLANYDAVAVNA